MTATTAPEISPEQERLAREDAAAWEAYGAASRGGGSSKRCRELYAVARRTMDRLAEFEKRASAAH